MHTVDPRLKEHYLAELRGAVERLESARAAVRQAILDAEAAGIPQRAIAEAVGVSQGKIWRILRNRP